MSSAICFNLDQSKILSSGTGLKEEWDADMDPGKQQFLIFFLETGLAKN